MTERIYEARNRVFSLLKEKGLDTGTVPILLQHITGLTNAQYLANMQTELSQQEQQLLKKALAELLTGKPIQHIIGFEQFYGRNFFVNEHVLIPRPETEELVYYTLKRARGLFQHDRLKLADIGTGSGAIAITMKLENQQYKVTATDICEKALRIAQKNAHQLNAKLTFKLGDLTQPIKNEKWDIILSNPPYIAEEEATEMATTVVNYEPHGALFAKEKGLSCYRQLAQQLPELMNRPGLIALEIGYRQGSAVAHLFQQAFPRAQVNIVKDINGKERMIFCELHE